MRRREFIVSLGSAVAWPLTTYAQQPAMPIVGYLASRSAEADSHLVIAFRQGLRESGFAEGQDVRIEYRWAAGQYDRLPGMAADLVGRQVNVIVASTAFAAKAAKQATASIPIVFSVGDDPVQSGLVASLARPGGNVTGITSFSLTLGAKRLGLLREIVPKATVIAMLVNSAASIAEDQLQDVREAARTVGLQVVVVNASSEHDFDPAFATIVQSKADALLVATDAFLTSRREQLAALAERHRVPAMHAWREFVTAGGLMSYGASQTDGIRQVGVYTGRVLKGTNPADLPVQQPTKFDLVINLKTAKALGLTVPATLLARADEVIE
jgi:putative ABC transport system substrate-binding protein